MLSQAKVNQNFKYKSKFLRKNFSHLPSLTWLGHKGHLAPEYQPTTSLCQDYFLHGVICPSFRFDEDSNKSARHWSLVPPLQCIRSSGERRGLGTTAPAGCTQSNCSGSANRELAQGTEAYNGVSLLSLLTVTFAFLYAVGGLT